MEQALLTKTKEVLEELKKLLSKDEVLEAEKNFILGELWVLVDLLKSTK